MAAKKQGTKLTAASEAPPPSEPTSSVNAPELIKDSPSVLVDKDALVNEPDRPELPVAGLVASAGGLDAFKKFFAVMPADSGIAFVLIPHLDPTHASLMVELLARHTSMPVVEATEGMSVEANRVYIIPPNKNMTIAGGVLHLTGSVERGSWQTSIDLFLRSLADDQMEKAICIILSGTGSHGTLGLKGSNEEVMSMNEELQSAYEELSTVNNQLHDKIEEVEAATNDMANLLNTSDIPTVFLDSGLRIKLFTPASARMFRIIATDRGRSIGDIVKRFVDDDLLSDIQQLLRNLIPREKEIRSEDGRWYMRRILPYRTRDNRIDGVVITFVDTTDSKLTAVDIALHHAKVVETSADVLHNREAHLAAILETAADAIITIDAKGAIQSINAATERMFGYSAAEMVGQNVKMIMPAPYRDDHDQYLERYQQTGKSHIIGNGREVEGRRKDGSIFPVDLLISEVDHLHLFTGILRDISRRKELEREVVEIASLEQRRIGQDLHDSVSQELTALSMMAGDLTEILRSDPSKGVELADRLVLGLQRSQQDLRAVMRGLCPVSVDAEGLMAALSDLANRTRQEGKVNCIFDCPQPVLVEDNLIATHLYLIAQEAVYNAVKHSQCQNIRIAVESNDFLLLRVQDDGIGISGLPTNEHAGLGLRIMRNRAAIIRATLTIESAKPTGTRVTCSLARRHHE